jgi:hypothetical protein
MRDFGLTAVEASRKAEADNARRGRPLRLWIFNHRPVRLRMIWWASRSSGASSIVADCFDVIQ